jgi:membrane protease YdiL (CAAX protease family)
VTTQIRAESLLIQFFQYFGVIGVMVPAIVLAVVLAVMHAVRGDKWVVRPMVIVGMVLESVMWVLPLIVLAAVVMDAAAKMRGGGGLMELAGLWQQGGAAGSGGGGTIMGMPWQAKATIAVGAGLYEELLFRMIGIAALDVFFKAFIGSQVTRAVLCAVVTAVLFAIYHDDSFTITAHGQGFFSVLRTFSEGGLSAALERVRLHRGRLLRGAVPRAGLWVSGGDARGVRPGGAGGVLKR